MKNKHAIAVIIILALACFGVYFNSSRGFAPKQVALKSFLQRIPEYAFLKNVPLEENIISTLELDDYINANYRKETYTVGLYIGYYFSLDKVSAAHSPLVCFPGSGWKVDIHRQLSLLSGRHEVNYNQFVAQSGQNRILVMYWYQAYDKTSPKIFENKLQTMINLMTRKKQEHAFVRVIVPLDVLTQDEARQMGEDFIKQFYPVFLDYIKDQSK